MTPDTMAEDDRQQSPIASSSSCGGEPNEETKNMDTDLNTSTPDLHQSTDSAMCEASCVTGPHNEECKAYLSSDNMDIKKDHSGAIGGSDTELNKLDLRQPDNKDNHGHPEQMLSHIIISSMQKTGEVLDKDSLNSAVHAKVAQHNIRQVERTEGVSLSDKVPPQPAPAAPEVVQDVVGCYLQYAEILYKCSLCATLPAILTSREHFSHHVQQVHLASRGHKCPSCHLHFNAPDDVKQHHDLSHLGHDSKMVININNNVTSQYHHPGRLSPYQNVLSCKSLNKNSKESTCPLRSKDSAESTNDGSSPRNVDDGADSTPSRSRRKRSFPRHLEASEQRQRSASTDSASSSRSEGSHNSDTTSDFVCHQMDQSLLRSDRKRLLVPWSHKTKVPPGEKSQNLEGDATLGCSDEESKQKATICYKPGTFDDSSSPKPSKSPITDMDLMVDSKNSPGPLDLVLQDRSRSSDTPKTMSTDTPLCSTSESEDIPSGVQGTPQHKKRKIQEEGIPSNRESPIPAHNDVMRMAYPSPSQYQAMYAAWSMNMYSLTHQQAVANHLMNRTCSDNTGTTHLMNRFSPDGTGANHIGFTMVKTENAAVPEPGGGGGGGCDGGVGGGGSVEKASPSCGQCKMDFQSAEQFCQHYKEVHLQGSGSGNMTQSASVPHVSGHCSTTVSSSTGDQQFKVLWLKQHITKYLLPCEGGVVLRDELLDHMMATGVDTSDTVTWGPACNRAVRETFQHSQAHRKGKFKKYFFGVKFVESLSSSASTLEETKHSLTQAEEDGTDEDDEEDEEDLEYLRGPGRCTKDLEKLTAHLPCIIRWTGHMDACITRDTLLQAMSRLLADSDVTTWGLQCSRAVKQLYPEVSIRRKGKYKTCYYGIEMINRGGRQLATWSRTNTGPPVVNVRDILETPAPSSLSRLPQNQPGARSTAMTSPHNSTTQSQSPNHNPLQAILDSLPTGSQSNSTTKPMWYQRNNDRGPIARTMAEGVQGGTRSPVSHRTHSPASHSRGSSPASDRSDIKTSAPLDQSNLTRTSGPGDISKTLVASDNEAKRSTESPSQILPLALTTRHTDKDDRSSPSANQNQPLPASPAHPYMTFGPVDALEKLVLLHPGPFVTARIFSRRFQRLVPGLDKVLCAMNMLQGRGLGQVFTLKQGNSKVFFKALPSKSLEVPLTVLGIRMVDYQVMFYERDQKLEDTLHDKLKTFYPQPDLLPTHYRH